MVAVFNDLRPMHSSDDDRLLKLQEVYSWFKSWETSVTESKHLKKSAALLSSQTMEDVYSMILGFKTMVTNHFKKSCLSIVPGRVNSDIVENFFCQQRTLINGNTTNPTSNQYAFGVNTIILTETPLSKKRNSTSDVVTSAQPFNKKFRL